MFSLLHFLVIKILVSYLDPDSLKNAVSRSIFPQTKKERDAC
jgi:hypothetical protein